MDIAAQVKSLQTGLERHHRVSYLDDAIRGATYLGINHPFEEGDPVKSAQTLLDEAASLRRGSGLEAEGGQVPEVRLNEVLQVAMRRLGLTIQELMNKPL